MLLVNVELSVSILISFQPFFRYTFLIVFNAAQNVHDIYLQRIQSHDCEHSSHS